VHRTRFYDPEKVVGEVEELLRRGELVRVIYRGEAFYVRKLPGIDRA